MRTIKELVDLINKQIHNYNEERRKAILDLENGKSRSYDILQRSAYCMIREYIESEFTIGETRYFEYALYNDGKNPGERDGYFLYPKDGIIEVGSAPQLPAPPSEEARKCRSIIHVEIRSLVFNGWFYMGAASILKMRSGKTWTFDCGELLDLTLPQLQQLIPDEYRKQLDKASQLDDIKRKLDALTAQGDRQLTALGEMKKTAVETRQGVAVLVQHLPDAKKPPTIEAAEAVAIMKQRGGKITDRTLRNWLKAGKAGRVKYPISWADLASTASWSAWVDAYLAAETTRLTRKSFISERAGKTQAEKSRRRSPTA